MENKFEVLEEDTGCKSKVLRATMRNFGAYLNIEVPNPEGRFSNPDVLVGKDGRVTSSMHPQHIVYINLTVPYSGNRRKTALKQLKKARENLEMALEIRDLYSGKFNEVEIDEDDKLVEQVYTLSTNKDSSELDKILRNISSVSDKKNSSSSSQLEQLFAGKLPQETLERLVTDVDAEFGRVRTDTGSTGIVRFNDRQNQRVYGKVSTSIPAILNEAQALTALQTNRIARILAPQYIGRVITPEAGVIFTLGTENSDAINKGDLKDYIGLFNTMLYNFAQSRGLDLTKLANSHLYRDVFNRAMINQAVENYQTLNPSSTILDLGVLDERAKTGGSLAKKLRSFQEVYLDAAAKVVSLDPGQKVFVHGDARPENIGRNPNGIRPLVDWANARMDSFAVDLSALETRDSSRLLDWYQFITEFTGRNIVGEDAKDLLICHDVLQPYRTGSFKIGKGRFQEAEKDIERLGRNAQRYRERFT